MGVFNQTSQPRKPKGIFGQVKERELQTSQRVEAANKELADRNNYLRQRNEQSSTPPPSTTQSTIGPLPENSITTEDILSGKVNRPDLKKQIEEGTSNDLQRGMADRLAKAGSDFTINAIDTAALGLPNTLLPGGEQARRETDSGAGTAGKIAGELVGFGKAYQLTRGLANKAINKGAGRAVERELATQGIHAPRAAKEFVRGGIAEGAFAGAKEVADVAFDTRGDGSQNVGERAQNVAFQAGLGAVGDAALGGVGSAIRQLSKRNNIPDEIVEKELLALPEPKQRGNANQTETPDVMNIPEGPRGLPEPQYQPTKARTGTRANPARQKYEELIRVANSQNFTPGREAEELQELWGRMAGPEDPGLDDLIVQAYDPRSVNADALNRGRSAQAAGAGPNVQPSPKPEVTGQAALPKEKVGVFRQVQKARQELNPEEGLPSTPPRVRDRVVSFMEEQEAGARERLKQARNRVSSLPADIYKDYAIIGASKIVKGTVKFSDWSEQMVREFGEEIRPRLREVYEQSKGYVQAQTKQATTALEFARGGGNIETFRKKIDRTATKKKASFQETFDKLRTQFVDDLAPFDRLEKNVKGKVSSAEESLYKTARLFRGSATKANDVVATRIAPIIDNVEKAGYQAEELGDYALAIHARDVNARGIKSGFTDAEIQDVIQRYENTPMEQSRQELTQINNDLLNDLVDSGVIARETLETLQARYPNYVPLFREMDEDTVEFGKGLSKAMANVSDPIKALKGSEKPVIDPLENMVKNVFQSVNAAERNRVAQQLSKLANNVGAEDFVRKLEPDEAVGRKNVVTVRENGEGVKYEVQPEVYKAMLGLDAESSNLLTRIMQKPAALLRAGATLTPEFSLRNPVRDIIQAYIVSNSGFNPVRDFPISLLEVVKGNRGIRINGRQFTEPSELYSQWLQDNAGYGNIVSMDRNVHREAIERVVKQPTSKKVTNILTGKSLISLLRKIADTTESATKLGEYRAALRSGTSRPEAAYRSRDIMDFSRAGVSTREINKTVAFLNANIQGKSKITRAIRENPVGVTARAVKMITLPTIAVFVAQKTLANEKQKAIIDDAPDWQRNTFWLIPVPGTDQVARIPKPFDLSPIFANLPERVLKYVFENDPRAFEGFVGDSLGEMSLPIMMSGLLPIVEGMADYSFFRQSNIIPQREGNLEFGDQYDINTPASARGIAKGFETVTKGKGLFKNFSSPRVVDNTIQGLTAGLGGYANDAIDFFVKDLASGGPEKPKKDISQKPLARAFLVNQQGSGKSMDRLYTERERLTKARGSARLKDGKFEEEELYQAVNTATAQIGELSKVMREIEGTKTMSGAEKKEVLDKLTRARNEVARKTMEILDRQ